MAKKKTVITPEYDAIRPTLDTGDIVLFGGKGALSQGIKWFTRSRWSHVGMVIQLEWGVFLWESTTLTDLEDFDTGTMTEGVQLVVLSERIKKYDGEIAVRRLECERTAAMLDNLKQLRLELRGKPYEKAKIELIKAAYDGPWGDNIEDLSSLFCSEMVAEAYQAMELLGEDKPSNEYTPADFSTETELDLLGDARLHKEKLIKA
ncbi:MAG: hypothetical protein L0Y71_05160 [Gemmataceae bacterium]|nr:hypothetical protein [Gemmataceae bacterium]